MNLTKNTTARFLVLICLYLLAVAVCAALIPLRRPGGDTVEMISFVEGSTSIYYYRSPFTLWLHQGAFHFLRPFGATAAQAMALCSCAAGGVFLLALLSISRHPLFLAFNLLSPCVLLFFGHLENYAWVNALLVVYLALLKRHVEGRAPLGPAAAVLFLACMFHMLALFTLPTVLCALWKWDRHNHKITMRVPRSDYEWVLIAFVALALSIVLFPLGFSAAGLDNNTQRLVPWFHNPNPTRYFFTFLSAGHLKMLARFHLMATPLGLPVLLALGWRIRTSFQRYAFGVALCGIFWTTIWHPDMGAADWDLFASFAFPLNVLAGLLLVDAWKDWGPLKNKSIGAVLDAPETPRHNS